MRDGIAHRLRPATLGRRLATLGAWRPLLAGPERARAFGAARVLRLLRPGSLLRTLVRAERHTRTILLRTLRSRETLLRRAPRTARPQSGRGQARAPAVPRSPALTRLVVLDHSVAPQGRSLHFRVVRTSMPRRVERAHEIAHRRAEMLLATRLASDTVARSVAGSRARAKQVLRLAPAAGGESPAARGPDEQRGTQPMTTSAAGPLESQHGAAAPVLDLDVLVDHVLRRIERRAIAQRERLGRA